MFVGLFKDCFWQPALCRGPLLTAVLVFKGFEWISDFTSRLRRQYKITSDILQTQKFVSFCTEKVTFRSVFLLKILIYTNLFFHWTCARAYKNKAYI